MCAKTVKVFPIPEEARVDMSRMFCLFVVLAATTAGAFAQSDNIQAGYAVVTPTGGSSAGLVVFETFGLRGRGALFGTTQAGVSPPSLAASSVLFFQSNARMGRNVGVAMVNPNATAVNVMLSMRDNAGTTLGSLNVVVPAREQVSKYATEFFANQSWVPASVTGTLTIVSQGTSPLPLSVMGLRFNGTNFSTIPATPVGAVSSALPNIASGVGGAGATLLPQFVAGGGWVTEIVISNVGTTSVTVRVDLFKSDGTPFTTELNGQTGSSFTNLTIPAGGVLVMSPAGEDF
jgi:hypothetical protein